MKKKKEASERGKKKLGFGDRGQSKKKGRPRKKVFCLERQQKKVGEAPQALKDIHKDTAHV